MCACVCMVVVVVRGAGQAGSGVEVPTKKEVATEDEFSTIFSIHLGIHVLILVVIRSVRVDKVELLGSSRGHNDVEDAKLPSSERTDHDATRRESGEAKVDKAHLRGETGQDGSSVSFRRARSFRFIFSQSH